MLEGVDEAERLIDELARGRRRLRRRRGDARGRRGAEVRRRLRRADRRASRRSGASSRPRDDRAPRARRADLVARPDRLDGRATRRAGSAGSTSRFADARGRRPMLARCRRSRVEGRSTPSCCSAWAARRSRPRCCGASFGVDALPRARHDASRRRSARSAKLDLERTLFVSASKSGSTLETRSHTDYFWKLAPRGDAVGRDHRSRARELEELAARARVRADLRGRADDRRPLLGAVAVRARAGRAARASTSSGCSTARARWRDACRLDEGNPGLELGLALGQGWQAAATRSASPNAGRLRPLGRAAPRRVDRQGGQGLVPAPGEPADGPDRQAHEVRLARPATSSAQEFFRWEFATAVAGSILGINPFDQPDVQAAKDKTNEVLAARRRRARAESPRSTSCFAQARTARLRLHPGLRQPDAAAEARARRACRRSARERDRLRRHARVRAALPALDRPAAQGRPEHRRSSSRSSRTTATSCDPRPAVRLRRG